MKIGFIGMGTSHHHWCGVVPKPNVLSSINSLHTMFLRRALRRSARSAYRLLTALKN